jgi:hypothetical protein
MQLKPTLAQKTAYWKLLKVVEVATEDGGKAVKVECILCGGAFSASNIPRFAKQHFKDDFTACSNSSHHDSTKRTQADPEPAAACMWITMASAHSVNLTCIFDQPQHTYGSMKSCCSTPQCTYTISTMPCAVCLH